MQMDVNRLSTGEKIAGASGILLFIFMFLDWFGVEVSGGGFSSSVPGSGGNAWDALDFIPIILVIAVVAAVAMAVLRLTDTTLEPIVPLSIAVTVLGVLSVLLILFRIIDPPSFGSYGGYSVDATLKFGIFLSLIAAGGVAYGGYRTMQEEGASFGDAADRLSGGRSDGPSAGPPSPPPPPPPPPSATPPPPPPPPTAG
jgi:uncharacterized membrane protein YhaH (DUF805 family)